MFSLILPQALLMSKLSSKISKAANLFEISTWYFSFTSMPSNVSDHIFLDQNFALLVYLLKFSPSVSPLPDSGQYQSASSSEGADI
jgi:hypothetical protein